MTAMTKKKPPSKKPEIEDNDMVPPPEAVTTEVTADTEVAKAHADAIKHLQLHCQEVRVSSHRLPSSRKIPGHIKKKMADAVGADETAVGGSKRIFYHAHPAVYQLNRLLDQADSWRDSFTIVKAGSLDAEQAEKGNLIASGVRLIRNVDIEEFDKGVLRLKEQIAEAAELVQHCLTNKRKFDGKEWPSIIDCDRERLNELFNQDDYPKDVTKIVGIDPPVYHEYHLSVNWPPAVYERAKTQLYDSLNGTMETATTYLTSKLTETFTALADKLISRVRIHPKANSPYAPYEDCEVIDFHRQPNGQVVVTIRHYPNATKDKKGSGVPLTLEPMAEEAYHTNLRPQSTDEKKKLGDSVVEGLLKQLNDFKKLKEMLGEHGTKIDLSLEKIRDILAKAGKDASEMTKEIKSGNFLRAQLGDTLNQVTSELEAVATEVKKARRNFNFAALAKGE